MELFKNLQEEYHKKQDAMWDASELADKYKHEFLAAERAYRKAHEEMDKEWRKINAS